jgi:hypothetical protein
MPEVGLAHDTDTHFETAAFHRRLNAFNHTRFEPAIPNPDWAQELVALSALQRTEGHFVEECRKAVSELSAAAPHDPAAFVRWFEELGISGPGQGDPLFPWLAEHASLAEMRWFLEQEVAGEAGFDDLVALTQIKMPDRAKIELARNYWDEMGQGHTSGMHAPMLARLSRALKLHPDPSRVVWESLALGNLMSALAANRRYAYHAVGALGVIELTAPGRAACVNAGLKRLGIPGEVRGYFALHATLDVKHSEAWSENVLAPLVEERPVVATAIAEGALLRLCAGARCFERYRRALWSDGTARRA